MSDTSKMALPPELIQRIEVFRNLQEGDVMWVQIVPDLVDQENTKFVEELCESIMSYLPHNVALFITPSTIVQRIDIVPLDTLLKLRDTFDSQIQIRSQALPIQ